jgi:hypothetical protein
MRTTALSVALLGLLGLGGCYSSPAYQTSVYWVQGHQYWDPDSKQWLWRNGYYAYGTVPVADTSDYYSSWDVNVGLGVGLGYWGYGWGYPWYPFYGYPYAYPYGPYHAHYHWGYPYPGPHYPPGHPVYPGPHYAAPGHPVYPGPHYAPAFHAPVMRHH